MGKEGHSVSKAEFQQNMNQKLMDAVFCQDISPLLRTGKTYDPEEAFRLMDEKLLSLLPGEEWRG